MQSRQRLCAVYQLRKISALIPCASSSNCTSLMPRERLPRIGTFEHAPKKQSRTPVCPTIAVRTCTAATLPNVGGLWANDPAHPYILAQAKCCPVRRFLSVSIQDVEDSRSEKENAEDIFLQGEVLDEAGRIYSLVICTIDCDVRQ
eukprot:3941604-Rhodomonas_salina.3